jgi:hypothetical protein
VLLAQYVILGIKNDFFGPAGPWKADFAENPGGVVAKKGRISSGKTALQVRRRLILAARVVSPWCQRFSRVSFCLRPGVAG